MSVETQRLCDFCGAAQTPSDRERWGVLMVGPLHNGTVQGIARDICPVCIEKRRAA